MKISSRFHQEPGYHHGGSKFAANSSVCIGAISAVSAADVI